MKGRISKFWPYVSLLACIGIFLALVLQSINLPIWFDEGYTAYLVKGDFGEIWSLTAMDVHPPFYYFLLKIWSMIFGTSLVSLRMMSVFFGVVAIILLFFLVKKWFGKKPAMVATLAMAISPFLVRYGMEMRMYMVILTIVLAATYVLTLAVENNQKRWWVLYAILVALGMYTHYFTALIWLTHILYLQFVLKKPVYKKPIIFAYLGAVLLYIPWIPALLGQMKSISGGFWIPPVTAETPVNFLTNIFFFKSAGELVGWSLLLAIAFLAVYILIEKSAFKVIKKEKSQLIFLLMLFVVPPLAMILVSLIYKPMFVDRYLIPSSIIAWVLLGVSFAFLPFKKVRDMWMVAMCTVVIVSTAVVGNVNILNRTPDSYVAEIVTKVQDTKLNLPILADDIWVFFASAIYADEKNPVYGTLETTFTNGWGSEEPMKYFEDRLERKDSQVYEKLEDFLNGNKEFWYVTEKENRFPEGVYLVLEREATDHHFAYRLRVVE